jgi:phosphoglycolate phosphatase-like HAD superfamily hydrolase
MIKVIVFDFDGTLVQSNQLKYDAYFELFPKDDSHDEIIRRILNVSYEESRYVILEKILRELAESVDGLKERVKILAAQYNDIVVEGAKICPECSDATGVLQQLSNSHPLYLSSTTPEEALRDIVNFRGWAGYFQDIFGYPRKKPETLQEIMKREQIDASQLLVVGDGNSDRNSAENVGCDFFDVKAHNLAELQSRLEN